MADRTMKNAESAPAKCSADTALQEGPIPPSKDGTGRPQYLRAIPVLLPQSVPAVPSIRSLFLRHSGRVSGFLFISAHGIAFVLRWRPYLRACEFCICLFHCRG